MSFPMPGSNRESVSREWLVKNIQQGHGPLGAAYPDVAYGMEGDTPSFLWLISNGLNDPEHPDFGGWGGRYRLYLPSLDSSAGILPPRPNWPVDQPETRSFWTNSEDSVISLVDNKGYKNIQATIWRWREDFQNDFAARIIWTHAEYKQANHPPVPALAIPDHFTVKSGETFHLNADGTSDPDGDSMSYLWFQYPEAGTYKGYVSFSPYSPNLYDLPVTAPTVDAPVTLHFILRVTDKGTPALSRYKRVIVTVLPKSISGYSQSGTIVKGTAALNCLNQADAEKILGQAASLTENRMEQKADAIKYRCTYTAIQKEAVSGKTGHLYYMFEKYKNDSLAKNVFDEIVFQNTNMANFNVLDNIGDNAIRHTDNENFDMIIVRKGSSIIRLKVNKLTRMTSANDLRLVAEKITGSL